VHEDGTGDFYVYEGANVEAILHTTWGAFTYRVTHKILYDGVDQPVRLIDKDGQVAYYELDVVGNVRRLRGPGGTDLGGYRYTAFGKQVEASAGIEQPLRWQGRLYTALAGGMYDVRARQWSPQLGVFLSADEFQYLTTRGTLWSWPGQNPVRWRDASGRAPGDPYDSSWDAARAALHDVYVLGQSNETYLDNESGGLIYQMPNGKFSYTPPVQGDEKEAGIWPNRPSPFHVQVWDALPACGGNQVVGDYHTHSYYSPSGNSAEFFSSSFNLRSGQPGDIEVSMLDAVWRRLPSTFTSYLGTPKGRMGLFQPFTDIIFYTEPGYLQ